ncbi:hypothetical protein ECG_02036 [Echinococcus granulosus]|nr:hypothetical protein ECG_02036 [Echinococcus granulosus]
MTWVKLRYAQTPVKLLALTNWKAKSPSRTPSAGINAAGPVPRGLGWPGSGIRSPQTPLEPARGTAHPRNRPRPNSTLGCTCICASSIHHSLPFLTSFPPLCLSPPLWLTVTHPASYGTLLKSAE